MKKNSLYLMALTGCLIVGCDNPNMSSNVRDLLKEKGDLDATLLHKENFVFVPKEGTMTSTETYYYFDTDNNPDTAEIMLQVTNHSNAAFLNSFNKAKIGKIQKVSEWHNDLTNEKSICIYYKKEQEKQ